MVDETGLVEELRRAIRFNAPAPDRPGYRSVGFILPEDVAWPSDRTAYDITDKLLELLTTALQNGASNGR